MSNAESHALPPGPRGALIQTLRYFRDPYGYYEKMGARYGKLFTMPTMNGTLVVALSADGAKRILEGGEDDFVSEFGFDAIEPMIGGRSLLLSSGDRHKNDRKLLSPTFTGSRMRSYAGAVVEAADRELARWSVGDSIRLRESMSNVSIDVIIRTVFGVQADDQVKEMRTAIYDAVVEVNPALIFFKFLQRAPFGLGPWARFLRNMKTLDDLIYAQIQTTRAATGPGTDVLSRMLESHFEDGEAMDDTAIRDHLVTLLMAGHETTGTTLAWALYELLRKPELIERVRKEVEALGPDPDPNRITALPLLGAVCQETLRMHPVLPEFFRTVRNEYEIDGYRIPSGVTLAGGIIAIHRDASLYPEPLKFRPERFIDRRYAVHEMASFGGGHRYCLGASFAMNELKIVIARVVMRTDLELVLDRPLATVRRNGTLAPEADVPVRVLKKRT
ncbi:MAG: cytochrome P450 [Myxococcota bacterium]|jgi:cytochrome P450